MSIFKDTFVPAIQDQLRIRQNCIQNKNQRNLHVMNTRNSWVRMSSSVNVGGSSALAKQYVLKGGTLKDGKLKYGLEGDNGAYSSTTPSGISHRLGVRPMAGINDIHVKSKDAYGSLREVVVKFQCWDIHQLEDLELLYMRPGYTVLIEWGWSPYLNNKNEMENSALFYDILDDNNIKSKEQIFIDLFNKSSKDSGGNYDAMFGYVKNYSWRARPDGGYDCTTTIISIGEIIESLKVNYTAFKARNIVTGGTLHLPGVNYSLMPDLNKHYSKNILAGLFYELFNSVKQKGGNKAFFPYKIIDKGKEYTFYRTRLPLVNNNLDKNKQLSEDGFQTYITLESLVNIMNNYVLIHDLKSKTPLMSLSTKERKYDKETNDDKDLLCSAHPLQISVDPSVCIIKSPLWTNGFDLANVPKTEPFHSFSTDARIAPIFVDLEKVRKLKKQIPNRVTTGLSNFFSSNEEKLGDQREIDAREKIYEDFKAKVENNMRVVLKSEANKKEFIRQYYIKNPPSKAPKFGYTYNNTSVQNDAEFYAYGDLAGVVDIGSILGTNMNVYKSGQSDDERKKLVELENKSSKNKTQSIKNLEFLSYLEKEYFYQSPYTELGVIGNVYINLEYLYGLAVSLELESSDRKEKNEISVYDFMKKILSDVQSCLGNVSHLEIHVDPIDNNARIIDINYINEEDNENVYTNAFEIQVQNTQSIVRDYGLSSQIFPDQSSLVAIGAQFGGGQIGMENNTMIDFNKKVTDRIIPLKDTPAEIQDNTPDSDNKLTTLVENFKSLYEYFGDSSVGQFGEKPGTNTDKNTDQNTSQSYDYKNALRDVINYFQNITVSKIGKNKNIIPVKLDIDMDGIGGLVIGHVFRIPDVVLPKGYKGMEGIGGRLGFVITGIGHKVGYGDWITHLEAQTIILDKPNSGVSFESIIEIAVNTKGVATPTIDITGDISPRAISKGEMQSNVRKAVKFFKSKGFTDEQTAGIIGNLIHESGLDPTRLNPNDKGKKSEGIAQWRAERRDALIKKYGANYKDLDNQLNFIYAELLDGEKLAYRYVKLSKNVTDATVNFDNYYERSDGLSRGARIGYAKGVLEMIKKDNENT